MTQRRIYFAAAEPSGDVLAASVIQELQTAAPNVRIFGTGGQAMAVLDVASTVDLSELAIMGILEAILAYRKAVKLADQLVDHIVSTAPDTVVLVDSWGLMVRVAARLRKRLPDVRIVKLVGPQVWATRPGRAETLAALFDQLICLHQMEVPYYEGRGVDVTVMGNPALSREPRRSETSYKAAMGIAPSELLLLVLPGSRKSEIDRVAPILVEAAKQIKAQLPDIRVVFAPALTVADVFAATFPNLTQWATIDANPDARFDLMAGADLALACSGTVTSEVAVQGCPMIVTYKTGAVTWAIARSLLYQKTHITLLNIISNDREIVPEYVQSRAKPDIIAAKAIDLLTHSDQRDGLLNAQEKALLRMKEGSGNSAQIAAEAILRPL